MYRRARDAFRARASGSFIGGRRVRACVANEDVSDVEVDRVDDDVRDVRVDGVGMADAPPLSAVGASASTLVSVTSSSRMMRSRYFSSKTASMNRRVGQWIRRKAARFRRGPGTHI